MIITKKTRPNGKSGIVLTIPVDVANAMDIKPYDTLTIDIVKVTKK